VAINLFLCSFGSIIVMAQAAINPVPVQLGSIIVMAQWGTGAVGHSDRNRKLVASTTTVFMMTAIATAN